MFYKNGKLEGQHTSYHEYEFNIKKQIKTKSFYKNGKLDGIYIEFDEQGNLIGKGLY